MKNRILKISMLMALFAFTFSCGSDDEKKPIIYSKENPLQAYMAAAGVTEVEELTNSGAYEFGITFRPKVAGNISEVVVRLPDAQTDLRVTIWDADSEEILRTITIESVAAATVTSKTISPLALTKDHEYMITFNTDDWYEWTRTDQGAITYPIVAGNISVTGYGYVDGTGQNFPTQFPTSYYAGDLSFVFQQTE